MLYQNAKMKSIEGCTVLIKRFELNLQNVCINDAVLLLLQKQVSPLTRTSHHWIEQTFMSCFLESRTSKSDISCSTNFIQRWTNHLSQQSLINNQSDSYYFVFQQSAGTPFESSLRGIETFKWTKMFFPFTVSSCLLIHKCKLAICAFFCCFFFFYKVWEKIKKVSFEAFTALESKWLFSDCKLIIF